MATVAIPLSIREQYSEFARKAREERLGREAAAEKRAGEALVKRFVMAIQKLDIWVPAESIRVDRCEDGIYAGITIPDERDLRFEMAAYASGAGDGDRYSELVAWVRCCECDELVGPFVARTKLELGAAYDAHRMHEERCRRTTEVDEERLRLSSLMEAC